MSLRARGPTYKDLDALAVPDGPGSIARRRPRALHEDEAEWVRRHQPAQSAPARHWCSRAEQRCRDHGDPIWAAVCLKARRDNDRVEYLVAKLGFQPAQVLEIAFGGNLGELDLDCERSAVSLDDEVDLMVTPVRPQVTHARLRYLRINPD